MAACTVRAMETHVHTQEQSKKKCDVLTLLWRVLNTLTTPAAYLKLQQCSRSSLSPLSVSTLDVFNHNATAVLQEFWHHSHISTKLELLFTEVRRKIDWKDENKVWVAFTSIKGLLHPRSITLLQHCWIHNGVKEPEISSFISGPYSDMIC